MPQRFLIVGASGLIGRSLLDALGPDQACGTYLFHGFAGGVRFDMATERIEDVIAAYGPFTHAVILGASASIDACARDPSGTARLNVDGAIAACLGAIASRVVPIFASSDGVYDGSKSLWREDDVARPILTYGRQKLAVEAALAANPNPWLVLRIAKVLDPGSSPGGLLGPWLDDLLNGRVIRCALDQRFSPIAAAAVAEAISKLAAVGATGLFNLGGAEALSRYELLAHLIAALGPKLLRPPRVERCSIRDFPFAEPRPLDTSLSIDRLTRAIGPVGKDLAALCAEAVLRRVQ